MIEAEVNERQLGANHPAPNLEALLRPPSHPPIFQKIYSRHLASLQSYNFKKVPFPPCPVITITTILWRLTERLRLAVGCILIGAVLFASSHPVRGAISPLFPRQLGCLTRIHSWFHTYIRCRVIPVSAAFPRPLTAYTSPCPGLSTSNTPTGMPSSLKTTRSQ